MGELSVGERPQWKYQRSLSIHCMKRETKLGKRRPFWKTGNSSRSRTIGIHRRGNPEAESGEVESGNVETRGNKREKEKDKGFKKF